MIHVVLVVKPEIQQIIIAILVNQDIIKYMVMEIIVIHLQKFQIIPIMMKIVLVIKNAHIDVHLALEKEQMKNHIVQNVQVIIILFIIIHIIVLKKMKLKIVLI